MKKLLTALFLLYASINFAQINLEHTYGAATGWSQTGPSTWNYYTYDASTISVYDITHSLVVSAPTPVIANFTLSGVYDVSNNLYNNSGNWAWEIIYINETVRPFEYLLTVYDQTGAQLLRVDSATNGTIFNSTSGTKMVCNLYSFTTYNYYEGKVYSLGGTYYAAAVPQVNNDANNYTLTNPYPSPSNNMIHLTYELPAGINQAEMVITNLSGQVVKTCNVGNAFNDILLDTKQYAPGEYFYYIHSGNYTSATSRFLISR